MGLIFYYTTKLRLILPRAQIVKLNDSAAASFLIVREYTSPTNSAVSDQSLIM